MGDAAERPFPFDSGLGSGPLKSTAAAPKWLLSQSKMPLQAEWLPAADSLLAISLPF
jgi:hypothetical protein